jgi:MraZ protein
MWVIVVTIHRLTRKVLGVSALEELIGIHIHNVDEKGRLAVPSEIRTELGQPFYMTCLTDTCLSVYSREEWKKISEKLNAIPQSDIKAQRKVRLIFSNAIKCEPDKQGRVLIPQLLRERIGLIKEAVMIGASNRAEVWAKEKWDNFLKEEDTAEKSGDLSALTPYGI